MTYRLSILRRAQKELAQLPASSLQRVAEAIRDLAHNPRPSGCLKLSGREGWRIRIGDHWVVYEIDDEQRSVTVLHIGHRRDIYR